MATTAREEPENAGPEAVSEEGLRELLRRGFRFAHSLTHETDDAQDLVQEAWLAVLKTGGPWTLPYLLSTIRNRFVDGWRRKRAVEMVTLADFERNAAVHREAWVDDEPLAVQNGDLDRALARLNSDERATICLSAVEGYSAREIAQILDRPRGTILSMLYRGRQKLRRFLEPHREVPS